MTVTAPDALRSVPLFQGMTEASIDVDRTAHATGRIRVW